MKSSVIGNNPSHHYKDKLYYFILSLIIVLWIILIFLHNISRKSCCGLEMIQEEKNQITGDVKSDLINKGDLTNKNDLINNLILINSRLHLLRPVQKLPLETNLNDTFILLYSFNEGGPNNKTMKLYSLPYIIWEYNHNRLINTEIKDQKSNLSTYYLIVYCPSIHLIRTYSRKVGNKILNFSLSNYYYTYKTGVECKLLIDSEGNYWEPLLGRRVDPLKNKIIKSMRLEPTSFHLLGQEIALDLIQTYNIKPNT